MNSRLEEVLESVWEQEEDRLEAKYPDIHVFVQEYNNYHDMYWKIYKAVIAHEKNIASEIKTFSKEDVDHAVKQERARIMGIVGSLYDDVKEQVDKQ